MVGMKKAVAILLLLTMIGLSAGEVQYSIEADSEKALMNVTLELDCQNDCPVSNWRLDWSVPKSAEIIEIKDSKGEIDSFTRKDSSVLISTNQGVPRRSETLRIRMRIDKEARDIHNGWYRRTFNLSSFKGEKTTGVIEADNLISGWTGYGFKSSFTASEMRFRGEGSTNVRVNFGDGNTTRFFEFFGKPSETADDAYRVAVGTIGQTQDFERFPAATLSSGKYNRTVNSWSSGEYVSGAIRLREDLDRGFLPVLTHEVVHGLNERKLKWDGTSSSYFEEGTSKYAEFLMRKKLYSSRETDIGPRNLFGESRSYPSSQKNRNLVYTVGSKGSRDRLWEYYSQNRSFMKNWNPHNYPRFRSFGYAYSELVIRNFVRKNGSLHEIYDKMEFDSKVTDPEEKWEFFSQHMDMKPCNFKNRQKFENCLEEVNSYSYPIYTAEPESSSDVIRIEKLELSERDSKTTPPSLIDRIIRALHSFIADLT